MSFNTPNGFAPSGVQMTPWGDPAQYYTGQPIVTNPNYIDPRIQAQAQAQARAQGQAQTQMEGTYSMGSFVSGILLFVIIIVLVGLYIAFGDKYIAEKVKKDIENGGDIDAVLKTLNVKNNTTLGNSLSDTLTLNARVLSDVIPSQDSSYDLGSSTKKWDVTYTDSIVFENGVSMTSDSDGIQLNGSFGYRRKIRELSLDGTNYTLPHTESGYLYVLNEPSVQTSSYEITLPPATGSGTFFDFVAGTSISPIGSEDFAIIIDTTTNDVMRGNMKLVSENTGPGSSTLSTILTTSANSDVISVDEVYPIDYLSTGYKGIRTGSTWRLVDYENGVWSVNGTMILQNGPSVGLFTAPFG